MPSFGAALLLVAHQKAWARAGEASARRWEALWRLREVSPMLREACWTPAEAGEGLREASAKDEEA
jgi:hypothetical protein